MVAGTREKLVKAVLRVDCRSGTGKDSAQNTQGQAGGTFPGMLLTSCTKMRQAFRDRAEGRMRMRAGRTRILRMES